MPDHGIRIMIRGMTEEDAPACARMVCSSLVGERYGFQPETMAAVLRSALSSGAELFVAELPGAAAGQGEQGEQATARLAGFAWIDPRGAFSSAPYLRLIAVDELLRGAGTGAALLAEFETRTAGVGRDWCLLVSDFNVAAQAFYTRHGYRKAGELPGFAREGITEVLMVKKRGRQP
jgi:ribosomal protein S18 acetylase RimI-like enzyme